MRAPDGGLSIQWQYDSCRDAPRIETDHRVEDMSEVELDANSDVRARRPKVQTGPTLEREVVDVADATVIQPEREFRVRQHKIIGIRAHAHTAHQRRARA